MNDDGAGLLCSGHGHLDRGTYLGHLQLLRQLLGLQHRALLKLAHQVICAVVGPGFLSWMMSSPVVDVHLRPCEWISLKPDLAKLTSSIVVTLIFLPPTTISIVIGIIITISSTSIGSSTPCCSSRISRIPTRGKFAANFFDGIVAHLAPDQCISSGCRYWCRSSGFNDFFFLVSWLAAAVSISSVLVMMFVRPVPRRRVAVLIITVVVSMTRHYFVNSAEIPEM